MTGLLVPDCVYSYARHESGTPVAWLYSLADRSWAAVFSAGPPRSTRADTAAIDVAVDLARVAAVLRRIAYDIDELARARAVADLDQAAILGDRRAELRRRRPVPSHRSEERTFVLGPMSSSGRSPDRPPRPG